MSDSEEKDSKINVLIDELRFTFTTLETLDNTLESKSSGLFAFTAILVTIIIFTFNSILTSNDISIFTRVLLMMPLKDFILIINVQQIFFIAILFDIIIIAEGLLNLFAVIKPRDYTYPFTIDPNEILEKRDMSHEELKNEIIEDYRDIIHHHKCITIKKEKSLSKAFHWLKYGISLSFFILIILISLKIYDLATFG